jgi:excisionase family DNA binding protein
VQEKHEVWSPEELRGWLGIGKTKCYELLTRGEIPSYRIGNLRRIKRADVKRWLEDRRSTASEDL